jgi:hypothetical protein
MYLDKIVTLMLEQRWHILRQKICLGLRQQIINKTSLAQKMINVGFFLTISK